jgi:hypothetical protein
MPVMRFPERLGFGTLVDVAGTMARLVNDETGFRELLRSRGYAANQAGARFDPGDWPGAAVPTAWEEGPRGYPLQPDLRLAGAPSVRLRRLLTDKPVRGIVVGSTYRQEGYLVDGMLVPPSRTIHALEIALNVRSGRARIVLAHPNDVQPVPRRSRP